MVGWAPKRSLRATLPKMIEALKSDPVGWYKANKLNPATVAEDAAMQHHGDAKPGHGDEHARMMRQHHEHMEAMRQDMLWVHFLIIALGLWLFTSPFQFALFDPAAAPMLRDVTQERGLADPAVRNALTGWSDLVSGLLLMVFGALSLSSRATWAQWGTTAVGLWLLFAPLFFWTPSAAAYMNDTAVGALAITFSVLVR